MLEIQRNVKAAHVSSNLAHLASLVNAWEDYLSKATGEISKDDVVSLRSLAIDIRKLLLDASGDCQWLLEATNGQGSFDDQYLEFINGLPISAEVKSAVIDKVGASGSGGIVQYLREKVSILVSAADDEEAAIASEMRQINETHLAPAQTNAHGVKESRRMWSWIRLTDARRDQCELCHMNPSRRSPVSRPSSSEADGLITPSRGHGTRRL
ncbi:hypothetical protein ACQEVG_02880 [Streptomyces sp. CA-135486]|uniref:hypothetical protein n=1 Tax=Streptomyces sp. CA-135486 TaxID=3240049 RepID=UPI003D8D97BB